MVSMSFISCVRKSMSNVILFISTASKILKINGRLEELVYEGVSLTF
jgi:hypothetical protein